MGVLRGFERRLEGAVEGMFARAFRSGLQPIELAQAITRYCKDHKQVTTRGVVAPNQYRFILNPADFERMVAFGSALHRELGEVLRETCRAIDATMYGPPTFAFEADDEIMLGRFEVTGRTSAADSGAGPGAAPAPEPTPSRDVASQDLFDQDVSGITQQGPSGAAEGGPPIPSTPAAPAVTPTPTPATPTHAPPPPPAGDPSASTPATHALSPATAMAPTPAANEVHTRSAPALHLEVLDTGATLVLRHGRHTIGRSTDCDLPIDSTTVSRKHAVLVERGDTWWVFDLGSTNGTRVNGTRASELPVRPGDRLRIGTVDLLVREA